MEQRLLTDLDDPESFVIVISWHDGENLASASVLHVAIDEALDRFKVKATADAYDLIQEL